jgi:hypothetical protein
MNEAKGSWNGYFVSPAGNKEQFTLRQGDAQSDADWLKRVAGFCVALKGEGYQPYSSYLADSPEPRPPQPTATNGNGAPVPPDGQKQIPVESIKLAAGGDHPRWVIKGGNYKKYGITCWPETLEAAGLLGNEDAKKNLDPLKDNKPKAKWTALYVERQDEGGKWVPDKVVRLERAATK